MPFLNKVMLIGNIGKDEPKLDRPGERTEALRDGSRARYVPGAHATRKRTSERQRVRSAGSTAWQHVSAAASAER